jgi:hypothetical protein
MVEHFTSARRYERYGVELIAVSIIDDRRRADRVLNLSAEGARLESPLPLEPGTRSHFYFIIPDADLRITCVDVSATVVWSTRGAMGLRFDRHLGPIAEYLSRLASQLSMR